MKPNWLQVRGNIWKKVDILHTVSLKNKLSIRGQQTRELIYGFEESGTIKRQELTNKKTEKGTIFVNTKLVDLFPFADQEKVTYGLGYTHTLKPNNYNDPIIRNNGVDAAKIVIQDIGWYFQHFTPSFENQQVMTDQLLKKDPTEIFYTEKVVFRKDVNTNDN